MLLLFFVKNATKTGSDNTDYRNLRGGFLEKVHKMTIFISFVLGAYFGAGALLGSSYVVYRAEKEKPIELFTNFLSLLLAWPLTSELFPYEEGEK